MGERKISLLLLVLLAVGYTIVFSTMKDLTVQSHHSYYDFAVFLEYFDKVSKGGPLFSSLEESSQPGQGHWLSAHFTPIAYFFGFIFSIWPCFKAINWSQTIILSTAIPLFYSFARKRMGSYAAMCLAISFLLNPSFQYITLYEFEYLRFILPVGILTVGLVLCRAKAWVVFLSCFACLLIREDASFLVIGFGIYILLFQKRRGLGLTIALLAVTYLFVVLNLVMPMFRGPAANTHVAGHWFQEFGSTPMEIAENIFSHPLRFLSIVFHPYKTMNYIMYLLPFSFLPLLGLDVLTIGAFSLGLLALSGAHAHLAYFLYYISPILVAVIWATCVGVERLARTLSRDNLITRMVKVSLPVSKERVSFAVLGGSFISCVYFGPSPISIQFWFKDFSLAPFRSTTFHISRYQPTTHDDTIRKIARMIPADASVSTEQSMLSDVYRCSAISVFPYLEGAEYILIDKKNRIKTGIGIIPGSWDGLRQHPQFYYNWVEKRRDVFDLVHSEDGISLFKRKENAPFYPQPYELPPEFSHS